MIDIVSFVFDICQAETNVRYGFCIWPASEPESLAEADEDGRRGLQPDEKLSGDDGKNSQTTKPATGGILCA
ncbi:hypothetical protein NKJ40_01445 [Mesorhizobium sp. M0119]|uniref:hypothetical protein n=1 Tax=unclassified Mesorhizobium TaxID=325217 RepID=UPI003335678C